MAIAFVVASLLLWLGVPLTVMGVGAGVLSLVVGPRLQEWWKRRPAISVAVIDGVGTPPRAHTEALAPWAIDVDSAVAAEVEAAVGAKDLRLRQPTSWVLVSREAAEEQFSADLETFERELREWFETYVAASALRARTVRVAFTVTNQPRAAYADAVELEVELPAGVRVADAAREVKAPPERPTINDDRTRTFMPAWQSSNIVPALDLSRLVRDPVGPAGWRTRDDGRRLVVLVGDLHAGRSLSVEALELELEDPAPRTLRWRLYTKADDREVSGVFEIAGRAPRTSRPFRRLQGVLAYPDVDIVDDAGAILHAARVMDPPTRPPQPIPPNSDVGKAASAIRARMDLNRWRLLGLDEDEDEAA